MIRPAIFILISSFSLGACASGAAAPANAVFVPARLVSGEPKAAKTAQPPAVGAKQKLAARKVKRHRSRAAPVERVEAANRAAVREPDGDSYVGAVQLYPWAEGALYRLYTAPGEVSDIALEAGEGLVSVAAGDTVRWVIGDTSSGAGVSRRTHVLVKPSRAGLKTNLVIATDRRVYHVELESTDGAAMPSIAWTYPDEPLIAPRRDSAEGLSGLAAGGAVDTLNFGYRIEGDRPPWRPVRAFDDGRQVFIEFPPGFAQGEAPPLFVTGEDGRAELVNYRVRGRYYVVDRLFAAAELRLGTRRQQVVRIIRDDSGRRGARSGS